MTRSIKIMKPSRNLWPVGIILTFVIFISGTVCLVVMACHQNVDLVNANYYEQEIKYQSRIDDASRAEQLHGSASITYDSVVKRILLTLPAEHARGGVSGQIDLYRPSTAGLDRQVALDMKDTNVQAIDASDLQPGLWKIRATWKANNQEFFLEQKLIIGELAKAVNQSALR